MLLTLAVLAQLSVASMSPAAVRALEEHRAFEATHGSARLLSAAATEYQPHDVWAPFAVGGVVTGVSGLAVLAIILLARGDVWTSAAIGAVGVLAGLVILLVSAAFAIAFAIENGAHKVVPAAPTPAAGMLTAPVTPPESTRLLATPPAAVVFRF